MKTGRWNGFYISYIGPFALTLCNVAQNASNGTGQQEAPQEQEEHETPAAQQTPPSPAQPTETGEQQGAGEGKYAASVPSRGVLWQLDALTPEMKQAAKETAVSGVSVIAFGGAASVVVALLAAYLFLVRKKKK